MQEYLSLLGLETNWLPTLLGLIGLPILYANLATEVHRDYTSLVKDAGEGTRGLLEAEMAELVGYIERRLQVFQLDWWVVGAFGVLLFAFMSCGNVQALCPPVPTADGSVPTWSVCSADFNEKPVKAAMSIYTSLFAILIAFRLIWARVELASEAKSYYACGFKPGCVAEIPEN